MQKYYLQKVEKTNCFFHFLMSVKSLWNIDFLFKCQNIVTMTKLGMTMSHDFTVALLISEGLKSQQNVKIIFLVQSCNFNILSILILYIYVE